MRQGTSAGERGADLPGRPLDARVARRSCPTASTSRSPSSCSRAVLAAVFRFTRFGLLTRAAAESQDGRLRQRRLARPRRAPELDDQRGGGRRGRHPHRPDQPAHADHLHAVRRAGAGRRGGRPVPVPAARPSSPAWPSACCRPRRSTWPASTRWMPQTGVGRAGAADRHPRRPRSSTGRGDAGPRRPRPPAAGPGAAARAAPSCPRRGRHGSSASSPCSSPSGSWRAAVIGTFIAAHHRPLARRRHRVRRPGVAGPAGPGRGRRRSRSAASPTSWDVPFPIAPLLAALVATVDRRPRRPARAAPAGPHARRGHARVRLRHRGGVVPQQPRSSTRPAAAVSRPTLFGIDLGIGAGEAFPRLAFGLLCLVDARARRARSSPGCGRARSARPCSPCGPTSARRPASASTSSG